MNSELYAQQKKKKIKTENARPMQMIPQMNPTKKQKLPRPSSMAVASLA